MYTEIFAGSLEEGIRARAQRIMIAETSRAAKLVRKTDVCPLGAGMRFYREKKHLSQRESADLIGVPRGTYRGWEQGRHWPSAYYLPIIADVLDCSVTDLYREVAENEQ